MSRIGQVIRRYGVDALIVAVAIEAAVEIAVRDDVDRAPRTSAWFAAPAAACVVLPLLLRRRFPFAAPVSVWLVGAALSFVDGRLISFSVSIFLAGMAASFLLGNLADPVQSRIGLAVALGGAAIVVYNDPNHAPGEFLFTPALFAIAWLAGLALQRRTAEAAAAVRRATVAELEREAAARVAVAEERARIARELHDVVAHAVSVMVLQVGAVRHRLPDGLDEDRGALMGVEKAGRTALAEMRRLLGAMRREGDDLDLAPQPGLDRLDALLAEIGRAGLDVRLHVEGDPAPLPRALDLSAYRIVQEGLTNVLKHARASCAEVALLYGADELGIEVRDDGDGDGSGAGGYGLVGVQERVKLFGGEMSAGPAVDGGFVLRTRLPLEAAS